MPLKQLPHHRPGLGLLCVVAVLSAGTAAGQQTGGDTPPDLRPSPGTFARDEWRVWTSPFRKSSYSAGSIKKYLVPFVLISGGLIAADRKIADRLPNTNEQAKWGGRVSQLGASYSLVGVAGATYLIGQFTNSDHARETGLLSLEALGHTQIVVFGLKQLTNRERPLDHDRRGGFWEGGNSFPSGHAASAFAVATVFSHEYGDHLAVPIAAYTAAGLISVSRVGARKHWASDIFVGGSTGFLLGRYVYNKRHDPKLSGTHLRRTARVMPNVSLARERVALGWQW